MQSLPVMDDAMIGGIPWKTLQISLKDETFNIGEFTVSMQFKSNFMHSGRTEQ